MVIIFTKFHEDRSKNVDFLLMANFECGPFFLTQTLHKYVHTYHLKQTLVAKVCKDVADHDYNYVNGISHCLDFVFKNTFAARCTHIYLHLG